MSNKIKFLLGNESQLPTGDTIEVGALYHCEDTRNTYIGQEAGKGGKLLSLWCAGIGFQDLDRQDYEQLQPGGVVIGPKNNNKAIGLHSVAQGTKTSTLGEAAHSEGYSTTLFPAAETNTQIGNATVIGRWNNLNKFTLAKGLGAHAEGQDTLALGNAAHSEGDKTQALANAAHSEGIGTIASSAAQHTQGQYNISDTEHRFAHIVGWGTENARKNIHTIDTEGNGWFGGELAIGQQHKNVFTSIKNLNLPKNAPKMVKRGDAIYLFANSCFVISYDNGATFADYHELCENEVISSTDSTQVDVRSITPILLQDNRIAFFYSVIYRTTTKAYTAIRVRFINENNTISDYKNVVEKASNSSTDANYPNYPSSENASEVRGGYWEPFPTYIGNQIYVYYCNSIYSTKYQQSVDYVIYDNIDGTPTTPSIAISATNNTASGGKALVNRRPGMPSVAKLTINGSTKYYMVVECNDSSYLAGLTAADGSQITVGIALFSSTDGKIWTFNRLLFTDHGSNKYGAPFIVALPDGRAAISFQCRESIVDAGTNDDAHNRRVYTYISQEKNGELNNRHYYPINVYDYAPNEAGYWASLAEINGVLYTLFTHGLNHDAGENYTPLGIAMIANSYQSNTILYAHNGKGEYSFEENLTVNATNQYAHAEGSNTLASGKRAHAEGWDTQATSDAAHAEGKFTIASGFEAHAEGYGTVAGSTGTTQKHSGGTGYFTHAEGNGTKASGHAAHSEGIETVASGASAHAEGTQTEAKGGQSHAQGNATRALGTNTTSIGLGTVAVNANEIVLGQYNIPTTSAYSGNTKYIRNYRGAWKTSTIYAVGDTVVYNKDYYVCSKAHTSGSTFITSGTWSKFSYTSKSLHLLTIGNGSSDTNRTNAAVVDKDGNAWFAGKVTLGNTNKVVATIDQLVDATASAQIQNDVLHITNGTDNIVNYNLSDKVIVNFGDSIFGKSRPPEDISTDLAKLTGATVHNCAFGGCTMGYHSGHWDAFAMYRLADAITTGNWTLQDTALNYTDRPEYAAEPLALLKSLDFNYVDIITIAYGTNDWGGGSGNLDNTSNKLDTTYFGGALRYSIEKLLETFPNLQIFVLSPIYRFWNNTDGSLKEDITTKTLGGLLLSSYVEKARDISKEYFIPFIDNFYELGINQYNRKHYFHSSDGTHPIAAGRKLIAEHMAKELF